MGSSIRGWALEIALMLAGLVGAALVVLVLYACFQLSPVLGLAAIAGLAGAFVLYMRHRTPS